VIIKFPSKKERKDIVEYRDNVRKKEGSMRKEKITER